MAFFHHEKLAKTSIKLVRCPYACATHTRQADAVTFPGLAYEVIQSSHVMNAAQANKIMMQLPCVNTPGVAAPHVMQPNWRSCISFTHYDLHLLMCDAEKSTTLYEPAARRCHSNMMPFYAPISGKCDPPPPPPIRDIRGI